MAKPSKKKRSVSLTQSKYFRTGALALVGLVVAGGAFAATSGDLAYSARSLVAQVIGGIDTTPRITIARDTYTPSAAVWPGVEQNLAQFSVKPRYLGAYGYLRSFKASVHIDSKTAALYAGRIGARFVTCNTTACVEIPLSASTPVASTTSKGLLYSFQGGMTPQVGSGVTGRLVIYGTPYYGSIYAASSSPAANIKAQIDAADGAGLICAPVNGTQSCSWKSVPVETALAYGNWLKVNRGSGYAYGYWDINNSASLTATDADRVLKVAVGTLACPFTKKCDIDSSGSVTATDANLLLKYAVGSLPPPGTASTTPATGSVKVELVSTATNATTGPGSNDDLGTFKIRYKVTAVGADAYIPGSIFIAPASTTDSSATRLMRTMVRVERAGVTVSSEIVADMTSPSGAVMPEKGIYLVKAGTSQTFEVTTLVHLPAAGTAGMYRVSVDGISWDPTGALPYNLTSDKFSTSYLSLN